ncbi:cyclase family protein [Nocardioides sp. NBC_00368]|uniref:cyclase family protein n=1 Tax=Nocardioides sp. NBC_00368 TaxID=2976000 RepID=UPI002E23A3E7
MNPDLLTNYLDKHRPSRRDALRMAGAVGAAAALGTHADAGAAAAMPSARGRRPSTPQDFDDIPFDYADPSKLSDWAPGPYGPEDQRGSFNEVTDLKTAAAVGLLKRHRPVKTYNLGELMWNGFPAFKTNPPRNYEQRLTIAGYEPPPGFVDDGGVLVGVDPLGENKLSIHEERFQGFASNKHPAPLATTYQIGSQLDNLNHIGAGEYFYNGHRGPEIAKSHGTTKLGSEHMGPIATRGVLLDILGVKLAQNATSDLAEPAANNKPLLREGYRITVEDIEQAMEFGGISQIEPGDALLFHTGWNELLKTRDEADIRRWEGASGLPGIYLREARWLAQFRPAMVGSDTWALEVLGNSVNNDWTAFPAHQELLMRNGIRIGESYVSEELANDHVYEFVFMVTPQYAEGATAGNTPPMALAQPKQ